MAVLIFLLKKSFDSNNYGGMMSSVKLLKRLNNQYIDSLNIPLDVEKFDVIYEEKKNKGI